MKATCTSILLLFITPATYVSARVRGSREDGCHPRNNPVCVDGVTYQNNCLALSQGVSAASITNGPCRGDERKHFDGSGKKMTKFEMMKFAEEGFKLSGKVKIRKKPTPFKLPSTPAGKEKYKKVPPGEAKKVTRTTADGLLYVTKNHNPKSQTDNASSSEGEPPAKKPGQRNLITFWDKDTRSIAPAYTFPNWRLGELDWGSSEGGCSGTVIGSNKVLTAAHCVYDAPNKVWSVPNYFAPGRRRLNGSTREPWGRWPVLHATVYTAWTNSGKYGVDDVSYDVAVLTMGTNWAGNIGSYMGTLSIVGAPCTIDSNSRITGYPTDKPDGEAWTSGKCEHWDHECNANIVYHKCDIWFGHSGSGIYDSSKRVFAIQSGASDLYNTGYCFDSSSASTIPQWG